MAARRLRSRADLTSPGTTSNRSTAPSMSRPRRGAAAAASSAIASSATIQRSPDDRRLSMQLTVKAPPDKLREATSRSTRPGVSQLRDGAEMTRAPRSSRNKKKIVESSTESEEEEEEEEEEEDAAGEEDEDQEMEDEEDEDDEDAEGEEDEDMEDAPPPMHTLSNPYQNSSRAANKPSVKIIPAEARGGKTMAVNNDASDDDLSDLSEEDEEDELGDDDAEGEEMDDEEDAEGEDDSENDITPGFNSRSNTPDLSKLTRRQRAAFEEVDNGALMALSNEAQKKKHLTAEEHAMRRAEMARRRKNLSEKRNEEEKMDTINRLLKKQAPKRRGRAAAASLDAVAESGAEEEQEPEKASALYARYTQNQNGTSLALPEEWLETPTGQLFSNAPPVTGSKEGTVTGWSGRMVEEVA